MSAPILPHHHHEEHNIEQTKQQLDRTGDFQIVADVFKQLCDTNRLRIFWLLCHTEECVINIASLMEMTTPAVSHHLKQLKSSGLIISRRNGKEVYYKASDTPQVRLLHETMEQIMTIVCPAEAKDKDEALCSCHILPPAESGGSEYQSKQIAAITEIHDYMVQHLDQHITIDSLSRQFLMNPTTLKNLYKKVYGMPVAAHMKEHRMKKAAILLKETNDSIASIAGQVGYESQSKFSAAFKEYYNVTPNNYRK